MKKILISAAFLCSTTALCSAAAVPPAVYPGDYVLGVSPDGRMMVSEHKGTLRFIDIATGSATVFEGEDIMGYSLGMGRPISDDHTVVGTRANMAAYCRDGVWHDLRTPYPDNYNLANSITPDGVRICGSVGAGSFGVDDSDTPMQVPAVWSRQDDGDYGDPVILPYPAKDYTDRVPQYVMAVAISDDGNIVAGQMRDYSGFMTTLIFYTFENGEWVMHNEFESLANPDGIEIPPYPGDGPEMPYVYDFMSPEELAAYQAAVAAWEAAGSFDYSTYPREEDYMTDDEYAAYLQAWEDFNLANESYSEAIVAFNDAIQACHGQTLVLNNVLLSPDGSTAVSTGILHYAPPAGSYMERESFTPVRFDLRDGTHSLFPDKGVNASYMAADGTILGFDGGVYQPRQAKVYLPGDSENPISMLDYFEQRDAATAEWMKQNMLHDIQVFDEFGNESTVSDFLCSGTPCASPDLRVVVCAAENQWDYTTEVESYLLPDNGSGSVNDLEAALRQEGRIQVFSIDGRKVCDSAGAAVPANLAPGTYILKSPSTARTIIVK